MRKLTTALVGLMTNASTEVYSKTEKVLRKTFPVVTLIFILTALFIPASAAIFTVTNTNDSGAGSLRQAVLDANALSGTDYINFAINAPATVTLTSGELVISDVVVINGSSTYPTTISGNNTSRVIRTTPGVYLTLTYLNITGGWTGFSFGLGDGGGIDAHGGLVLNNCAVYGNNVIHGTGGGIKTGALTLNNSTVSGNYASISGGGIEFDAPGIANYITGSTIAFNTSGTGGGVHNYQAMVIVKNSIIANNIATVQRPDFSLDLTSNGYNMIGDTTGTNFVGGAKPTDALNIDPLLQPLADNGGATKTHGLNQLSFAIDRGDPAKAGTPDQRGLPRGVYGGAIVGRSVDKGAFERQLP